MNASSVSLPLPHPFDAQEDRPPRKNRTVNARHLSMLWTQTYTPCGSLFASALVAAVPVVVMLGLLGVLRVRAHVAALAGLLAALVVAAGVYRMPAPLALAAAGYGAAFGLLPIGWIVLCAIFVYDVTVKTGKFE